MSPAAIIALIQAILQLAPEVVAAIEAALGKSPAQATALLSQALAEKEAAEPKAPVV